MRIEKQDSEKIRAIGFLCALMVVAIHCTSIPKDWWDGTLDMPKWIIALQALGSDTVARLAVPWFFVISGFFLVKNLDIPECTEFAERVREIFLWWKKSIVKRLLTLGVPYLLWNLIYYIFKLATGKYGFDMVHCIAQLTGYNPYEVPACGQFWYVRCLIVYVVFAPVFLLLFGKRHIGFATIGTLLTCWFAGWGLPIQYMQFTDFQYIIYFGCGIYLGMRKEVKVPMKRALAVVAVLLFILSVFGVVYGTVARNRPMAGLCTKLMIVSGLPSLWVAGGKILALTARWKNLYGLAFFVYALHVMLASVTYKITVGLMSPVMYQSVGYLLKIAVGILGSLIVGRILARFTPRALNILCGGRG